MPCATLSGDNVVVEEEESTVVDHVTWVRTCHGWIAVQASFHGRSRTQLFAHTSEADGDSAVDAMHEQLDESTEAIIEALTRCPPEQLRGMEEVKELLKQQEFFRQQLRDLPGGHHMIIRQLWDEMQRTSGHHRRLMEEHSSRSQRSGTAVTISAPEEL
jgi:hypothetical protein